MYINGVILVLLIEIGIKCEGLVEVVNCLFYFVVIVWYYKVFSVDL